MSRRDECNQKDVTCPVTVTAGARQARAREELALGITTPMVSARPPTPGLVETHSPGRHGLGASLYRTPPQPGARDRGPGPARPPEVAGGSSAPRSALTADPEEGSPGGPGSPALASLQRGDTRHLPSEGLVGDTARRACGAPPRVGPHEMAVPECQFQ